jgi:hypothetical protein
MVPLPPLIVTPPPRQAYTSQILAVTMMALQLAEDSIAKRERRDGIIDELGARRWKRMSLVHCIISTCRTE